MKLLVILGILLTIISGSLTMDDNSDMSHGDPENDEVDPGATNKTTTTLDEENDATGNNTGNNTEVDNGEDEQTPADAMTHMISRVLLFTVPLVARIVV